MAMKIKHFVTLVTVVSLVLAMSPKTSCAQQSISASTESIDWKPAKVKADGNNVINGVVFFHKPGQCGTNEVTLIKIVNVNKFPVKVQWQESNDAAKGIVIPPSTGVEGKCTSSPESDEGKLVIIKSQMDKEGKAKQYMLSTLTVTEIKK